MTIEREILEKRLAETPSKLTVHEQIVRALDNPNIYQMLVFKAYFGSFTRGDWDPDPNGRGSDIDLMLVVRPLDLESFGMEGLSATFNTVLRRNGLKTGDGPGEVHITLITSHMLQAPEKMELPIEATIIHEVVENGWRF